MNALARLAFALLGALALALPARAQDVRLLPPRLVVASPGELPVTLRAVRITAEIDGALASTTVEMTFHNPNGRVLEGELRFPLLDGQSVTGFALDVDGRMRDAVPVEKARGQAVFEDIARARVDPGLLEATEGDNYKVRVYPIPARGERRVRVRYAETLPARGKERAYRVAVGYARRAASFSLEVQLGDQVIVKHAPDLMGDTFEVRVPDAPPREAVAHRFGEGHYFHAEGYVRATQRARALPRVVQLVWDSSGSMAARDFARERALLDAYFAAARDIEVHLVKVRDAAEPAAVFRVVRGDWSSLRRALEDTVHDGATNLGAVVAQPQAREVLLFTDGLPNFGAGAFLSTRTPVYAIASTGRSASTALRHLAEASGGRLIDLQADSAGLARDKLLKSASRIVALEGTGVSEAIARSRLLADGRFAIAGRLTQARGEVRVTVLHPGGKRETVAIPVTVSAHERRLAATTWAAWKVATLEADPDANRGEVRRVGRAFGLATRETSLIVLERVEDYVRHEVDPPAELAEAYARLRSQAGGRREADRQAHVERVVKRFQDKQAWWDRGFPKGDSPKAKQAEKKALEFNAPPTATAAPSAPAPARMASMVRADAGGADRTQAVQQAAGATIRLRAWQPDSPYARRMREADGDRAYRVYLDERPDYLASSAFFLDAADILLEKDRPALALRVLSNLAEMDLENRHLLRILGYRLMQSKRADLAVAVFRKVLALAPEEPQSYRDLGLAHQADGQPQKAVELLAEVVMRPWHGRFPDIELITLAEVNALVATAGRPLDTSKLDPRLLRNLPLDLRVIVTWDADNTDIDLWVTDPNGEKAFYGHQLTYQGGRMSLDFTGGYGPEEFSLRTAKPGTYKVEANFYGHRQQVVAGATTLQVKLTTGFGTQAAKEQVVTLRLKGRSEVVYVGDFEVR